jgi:hypothetical protein
MPSIGFCAKLDQQGDDANLQAPLCQDGNRSFEGQNESRSRKPSTSTGLPNFEESLICMHILYAQYIEDVRVAE